MQIVLFLIFIVVPIAEIALFIQAGQLIGLWPTIAITIGTAIAGSFLMRVQGFATLNRFSQAVQRGEVPVTPVIDGIGIFAAGLLLLTPGLLTDTIGLLLFVPPFRRALAKWAFGRALESGRVHVRTHGASSSGGTKPQGQPGGGKGFRKSDDVIDADFETIDPQDNGDGAEPLDRDKNDRARSRKKDSPWRSGS
jgi:UPF0716 protein FxsA